MKTPAFIITLDDTDSRDATRRCIDSIRSTKSPILPMIFPAVDKTKSKSLASEYRLEYTYAKAVPMEVGGMKLKPYQTADLRKRVGCFMSHYLLWEMIRDHLDELSYAIILEQDAIFTETFDKDYFDDIMERQFICSINSPIGATRLAQRFDSKLKNQYQEVNQSTPEGDDLPEIKHFEVPWIDNQEIPQGLPGNSAYIITPGAARILIETADMIGIWPNDAMMCKQIMDDILYCAYPYYTKVQGLKSTTSL